MEISNAQYIRYNDEIACIHATIDGVVWNVPIAVGNRYYDEIMRQVEAGTLTIAEAE
jgi:hypothetical protein